MSSLILNEIFDIRNKGAPEFRQGIFLPGDGGPWERVCSKLATRWIVGLDRLQRLIFRAAQKAFEQSVGQFKGQRDFLALQLIRLVEQFLTRDKLDIPSLFHQDEARWRILIALNLDAIVQHLLRHVEQQNRERLAPVFDSENPIGSTRAMRTWYSTKTCLPTQKSQIRHLLADSSWEQMAANLLEMDERVLAYAKNDHLGFEISYLWNGVRRRYLPDFLIRLNNGQTLVLKIKDILDRHAH